MIGAGMYARPVAATNVSTWGVNAGDDIQLEISITFSASIPAGLQTYIPVSISSILGSLSAQYDIKIHIESISDANTVHPEIALGNGEVINATITGKNRTASTYISGGAVIADYASRVIDVMNIFMPLMGESPMSAEDKAYVLGNISAMAWNNIDVSCWVKPSAISGFSPPADFPLSTIPIFTDDPLDTLTSMFIVPSTLNLQTLYNYGGSMWNTYMSSYMGNLDAMLNSFGSYVKVDQRTARMGWSLAGLQKYLKDMMGYDPIASYAGNAKFDLGMYYGFDERGVLSASCVYMDMSATLAMDLTSYSGPNLSGDIVFSAAIITNQPNAYVPTKEELYISSVPGFPLVIVCIAGLCSVTLILLRLRRLR
jgi:hypothetical protein